MRLSQLSLGCMQFTGKVPEEDAIETVKQAVARGVNHIETARCYGNSEERVGKALREILREVPRDQLYITTKIGPSSDLDEFKKNWDISMGHLGLDYLDNLDFHGPGQPGADRPGDAGGRLPRLRAQAPGPGGAPPLRFLHPRLSQGPDGAGRYRRVRLHQPALLHFNQGLRPVVQRAAELDMGVFIISPSAQGGNLHEPPPRLAEACAPCTR